MNRACCLIEYRVPGISALQATTDANEISAIRQRVEAQAATLDLVAKESADAKRLLEELKEANISADDKLKLLEKKTIETAKLAEPTKLEFKKIVRNNNVDQLSTTVYFSPTKNEALGGLKFSIAILNDSKETIIKIWPSLEGGPFLSGDESFQIESEGKLGKLYYTPLTNSVAFDIILSGPASIEIDGNRLPEPVRLNIE